MSKGWTNGKRKIFFYKVIYNEMTFSDMLQSDIKTKFFCNTDQCNIYHTGRNFFITITSLGILTESTFHGNRFLDDHIVNTLSVRFDSGKCSAKSVGAAWTCCKAGDTGFCGHIKARIHRVNSVNSPELRSDRGICFIVIGTSISGAVSIETNMAVRLHKSRSYVKPGRIDHLFKAAIDLRCDFYNFTGINKNISQNRFF